MVASPITGCGVNQQITQVKLAISSPFIWNRELDNTWFVCGNRHAISQFAGLAPGTGICKQYLAKHSITVTVISARQPQTATQNNATIHAPCLNHFELKLGKLCERQRLGGMLIF